MYKRVVSRICKKDEFRTFRWELTFKIAAENGEDILISDLGKFCAEPKNDRRVKNPFL